VKKLLLTIVFFFLTFSAHAAEVMTQWGQDPSGVNRTVYVLDPTDLVWVPIGSFNTASDTWSVSGLIPPPSASVLGGVFSSTAPSNQFMTGINITGTSTYAQPGFINLSGNATVAQGGTNCTIASGTCLDNITGFSSTGLMQRTGAGTYSFGTTVTAAQGGTNCTIASGTCLDNITGFSSTGLMQRTGAGTYSFSTLSALLDTAFGSTQGDILYRGSAGWAVLAPGTAGYALESGGPSANPAWAAAVGSGTVTSITAAGGLKGGIITTSGTIQTPGGDLNKFRNGGFNIWQRGGTAMSLGTSGAYFADGWIVYFAGSASVTALQGTGVGAGYPLYSLEIEGATSNTGIQVGQRIESYVAAPLAGRTVTVQFWYYQNTGSTVTPKISTCYASASDNFSTCTADLASSSLTACATGTWCQESYTLIASASAGNGYEVDLDCNAGLTSISVNCRFADADIRATPNVSTGVNTNPPPPELREITSDLASCRRYYQTSYPSVAPGTITTTNALTLLALNTNDFYTLGYVSLGVTMRATPTFTMYSAGTGAPGKMYDNNTSTDLSGVSFTGPGPGSFTVRFPSGGMTSNYSFAGQWTASAEL
jgi:hypothetical protein